MGAATQQVRRADRSGYVQALAVNPDGTDRARLTTHPEYDSSPVVSADGRKVAFISSRTGVNQIWVMNADGSGQTQVGADGVVERGFVVWTLSWAPNGRIFYSNRDGVIVSVNADGTGGASTGITGAEPAVSPNGTRIAYVPPPTGIANGNLWVADLNGANAIRLTDNPDYTSAWHPDWSPDGTRVAFTLFSRVTAGVGVVGADGSGLSTVPSASTEYGPQWSPDGARILITGGYGRVFDTVKPDGTGRSRTAASPGGATAALMAGDWAVVVPADAAVTLTAAAPITGSRVDYTIGVANSGPATLGSATVVLTLPAGITPTLVPAGCTASGNQVSCVVGPLEPGKSTQRVVRTVADLLTLGQRTARVVKVAGTPVDPNPANDSATATCDTVLGLLITC
ncbi:DUF11 domain-containing protein [Actinokineospora auranticolor]|uniref:Putative repeat protein (TIGR01451 family) n=1 Tax=Actinokineospora auranticolor TaxID=155976 RepID=A0A2S6GIX1_9PSEU|nr:DUF11 domain-containing protein [Actinokineospora auranticolor]PPK65182.1 putative repeat protein (TIGR01451 family) [Actinokineospora auranticolor]